MAIIPAAPLILKDVTFEVAGSDFKKHVSSVSFTPSASTVTWTGLGTNTITDTSTATWTAAITYAQDWTTANSLSRYLYDNEGATVAVTFKPQSGAGPSFTADVVITPGAIGGAVNAVAETSVTLGLTGKPVLVPAA